MFKRLLIGGVILGGVALFVRKKLRSSYDEDAIDSAEFGDFGNRSAAAPEQQWSTAQTRHDVTPEELSTAARVEQSLPSIMQAWPSLTEADVKSAEYDRDRLAALIAEKTGRPKDEVRTKLDGIIAEETPRPSYPAQ